MGFFDDVMDAVSDTVSTGVKKALDLAEPLVHAFKDKDARDVAGGGGYIYTQYPDGSIIIKEGPSGLHDVKVKNGTKAWKAITTEIGPWVPPAHNSQQLSEGDDEVIILPDDHSNNSENPTEFADGLSDPYEQLEFCMDDIERSLGHLRDNSSSGQHNELIDRANSICDNYPEMIRLLGELGDVPNDELNSYLDQLKSVNKELQDADFADERKHWEANAGERRELFDAIQHVPLAESLQVRYRTIVENAESHYMYAVANAEWEAFAVECNNQLADFEAGLVPVDDDSEAPPYYQNEGAPADEEYPEYDGGASITVVSSETEKDSLIKGLKAVRLWHKLSGDYVAGGSVKEMVDAIIEKSDGQKIGELTISGHGHSGHQNISDEDAISARLGPEKRTELARLAEHFTPDAIVTLEGCEVGAGVDGEYLLNELASLWGVRVRGGVAYQRPILYPGIEGSVTTSVPTNNGPQIEQDDAMTNEMWQENPIDDGDDDALAFVQNAKDGELAHVSLQGRYERAKKLLSGWTGTDEGEAIVTLFRSATPADRRELYRLLESHKWDGEFHNGVFADDDGLVNALTDPQLEELRYLLG